MPDQNHDLEQAICFAVMEASTHGSEKLEYKLAILAMRIRSHRRGICRGCSGRLRCLYQEERATFEVPRCQMPGYLG